MIGNAPGSRIDELLSVSERKQGSRTEHVHVTNDEMDENWVQSRVEPRTFTPLQPLWL
ncbi:hypothetical protein ACFQ88_38870 [Paenibacillus sp. NPDC056579]|uniref:hypothetical protein n=1 Tax=unclassified Paenibacillus TaxID=185978 RepID=UPI001EF99EBA|nr:hypothetical protein [Paenibacillus sp. H1-7]